MEYAVFDTLLDAVLVIDADRKIVYRNDAMAGLCGVSPKRLKIGSFCHDFITFDDTDLFCMPGGQWGAKECTPYKEVTFHSPTGLTGRVQVSIQPVAADHWVIFARDVSLEQTLHSKYRSELGEKEAALVLLRKANAELEEYSTTLEKKVADRTVEITHKNQLLGAILNSLGQGFFIFGRDGVCLDVHSKACELLLEQSPAGRPVWDILKKGSLSYEGFESWKNALFMELIPFEDLVELGPHSLPHSAGKQITLQFFPMQATTGPGLDGVVVVATDQTREHQALLAAERERAYVSRILKQIKHKVQFASFVRESFQMISALKNQLSIDDAKRFIHTIKGGAAAFEMDEVRSLCQEIETSLVQGATMSELTSLPHFAERLEGEFKNFFEQYCAILGSHPETVEEVREVPLSKLNQVFARIASAPGTEMLQECFKEALLKEPIQKFFTHYDEVVANLATQQGKKVAPLRFIGGDLRIFPTPATTELFGSMVHAFSNAVDHGLEPEEEREQGRKPRQGEIEVSFQRVQGIQGPWIRIQIKDDGRGIDPEKIRAKLMKSQPENANQESDEEVLQHVFKTGFSTAETLTITSGRGVGMDAISMAAKKAGGTVHISSRLGFGTSLTVEIPELPDDP